MSTPTLVQTADVVTSTAAFTATFPGSPTSGNLMIALLFYQSGSGTPATDHAAQNGWTRHAALDATHSYTVRETVAVYYKYAGGGESATQSPAATNATGYMIMYEVAGASATWSLALDNSESVQAVFAATQNVTALNATAGGADKLALLGYGGRRSGGGVGPTLSGASFTQRKTTSGSFERGGGGTVTVTAGASSGSPAIAWPTTTATDGTSYAMVLISDGASASTETGTITQAFGPFAQRVVGNVHSGIIASHFAGFSQALVGTLVQDGTITQNFGGFSQSLAGNVHGGLIVQHFAGFSQLVSAAHGAQGTITQSFGPFAQHGQAYVAVVHGNVLQHFAGFGQVLQGSNLSALTALRQFWTFG